MNTGRDLKLTLLMFAGLMAIYFVGRVLRAIGSIFT